MSDSSQEKLDFKVLVPVLTVVLVDLLGLTLLIPLIPLYAAIFGANELTIGLLAAMYPLMQFIGAPILGQLSDKFGRKPLLIISQIGTFSGFILLGFANTLSLIFLSRIIDGISGGNISIAQAVITDRTTEKTRTQGLGLIGAAFGLGFVLGPLLAFAILAFSDDNYSLVAFVAAGFSFISILLTTFWLEESHPVGKRGQQESSFGLQSIRRNLQTPTIAFLLTLVFLEQFAFAGIEQFFPVFTLGRLGMDGASNAAIFLFIGIILVVVQGSQVGKWSKRYGDRWLIFMGLAVLGIGMILTALTPEIPPPWYDKAEVLESLAQDGETANLQLELPDDDETGWLGFVWLVVMVIPISVGAGVMLPAMNSMITQRVAAENIGNALGTSTSLASLGHVFAPLVFGAIFQWLGTTAPYLIGGIIMLLLWFLARSRLN